MKKIRTVTLLAFAALFMLIQTGCIGSFGLTHKVYSANKSMGNKWVNELVFLVFCVVPVYEISILIDAVILNFIEFWSGANPLAMAPGQTETKQVLVAGKACFLTASRNRFHLESVDKSIKQDLVYNEKTTTWTLVANNKSTDICTYNANGTVTVYKANHSNATFTADALKKMADNKAIAAK